MLVQVEAGKDFLDYADWIETSDAWGGMIELSILAEFLQYQICAVDIRAQRVEKFPFDDAAHAQRVVVFFDGIHYDAFKRGEVSVFSTKDDTPLAEALAVGAELNKKKQFTDTAGFTLMCGHCMKLLKGQKEAQEHAKETGHFNFQEAPKQG